MKTKVISGNKWACIAGLLFLCATAAQAHTINYEMASMSKDEVGWSYLKLGFEHIVPLGVDHILFVLSIFFLSNKLSTIL